MVHKSLMSCHCACAQDKNILGNLSLLDRERIMEEIKYDILCTDLAVYFQLRAQLAPIVGEHSFDWADNAHRRLLKVLSSAINIPIAGVPRQ
jgi:hypothetical protein